MKRLAHLLFLLVLTAVTAISILMILKQRDMITAGQQNDDITGLQRSVSYELSQQHWSEFPLPQSRGLRVLNTPLLSAGVEETPGVRWGYALQYQLLDGNGKVLRDWQHYYRPGMIRTIDPVTRQYRPRSFVEDWNAVPIASRSTEFEAGELEGGKVLRVRIRQGNPSFTAILVRVYTLEKQAEHRLGYLWERLSLDARERLAQVSVYGSEYLRETEKINLLRWRWRPIGPAGIEGQDYQQRILYTLKEELIADIDDSILPEGIYVDTRTRGILPVPAGRWDLELEIETLAGQAMSTAGQLQLSWRGHELGQAWNVTVNTTDESVIRYRRQAVSGGLIEMTADRPVVVRAFILNDGKRESLQSPPSRLRSYLSEAMQAVEFEIEHIPGMLTPLRVDVRGLVMDGNAQALQKFETQYQLLGKDGKLLDEGRLDMMPVLSEYDRVTGMSAEFRITEPQRFYFRLHDDVVRLRLFSLKPVAVSVYTRPPDLRRYVRVPEDYQNVGWDPQQRPAWFYLRALDHDDRIIRQQVVNLVLQTRPADTDLDIQQGRYQRVDYEPYGKPYARQLLVPRSGTFDVPGRSRAGIYTPLPVNREVQVELLSFRGREQLVPTLIYVGTEASREDVSVSIDGKPVVQTRLFSSRAQIRLPAQLAGTRNIHIRTRASGRWWINYAEAGSGAQLMRRAWAIDNRALQFDYIKQDADETLTGTLYCGDAGRMLVDVDVSGPAASDSAVQQEWTFRQRTFDMQHESAKVIPVFDNPDDWLNIGQGFFLPLNADLPPDSYRIKVQKRGKGTCYMTLHRLLPGQPEIRRFFREQDLLTGESP